MKTGSMRMEPKAMWLAERLHSRCRQIESLRQGAAKGRKVLSVWDRAGIDFRQWFDWKHGSGIYFLSREKDNMNPDVVGNHPFDAHDPVNHGILADQIVAPYSGVSVRRVSYQDPSVRTPPMARKWKP